MKTILALFSLFASLAFSQGGNTSLISGVVTDPAGAAVPGAQVQIKNTGTNQLTTVTTNDRGEWAAPSMLAGAYSVTVSKQGFKGGTVSDVNVQAGVPATVNLQLEVGATSETVTVTAGAEIVQGTSAELSNTLNTRELADLPFATRNSVELLVTQPGTQTPTNPRSSSVNGLPKGAINITIDGMNTQDNNLKSNDGFFSYIYTPVDAMEEVTLSTSASGVDSTGAGAAQIKFVTRSGTNQFHGGVFWQLRNTDLDANYYFNNEGNLPRDIIKLNQGGFHVGGPILKNRLFFFANYEEYRSPGTSLFTRTILNPTAISGVYSYSANGSVQHINLYQLAAAANGNLPAGVRPFATTPDPIVLSTLNQVSSLSANGIVKPNSLTSADYNTSTMSYQPNGTDSRDFLNSRIDYNITEKHHLALTYNYNKYVSIPDFLNSVVPIYPGTGSVLGQTVNDGQRSNRFDGNLTLRSALSATLTNEARAGLNGGTVLFRDALGNDALYQQWKGYIPTFGTPTYLSGVTTATSASRRNAPVKDVGDTVSWVKGTHQFGFGFTFDQINLWQQSISSTVLPRITFGAAAGDPINTGSAAFFTAANFPGASSSQISTAATIYSILTGRVSSITTADALSEASHTYQNVPAIDRDQMREYSGFIQDIWRAKSNLTVTLGLRYEKEGAFTNSDNLYTHVGIQGVYGVSGVGNVFKPGVLTGTAPAFTPLNGAGAYDAPSRWLPSIGVAWQTPAMEGFLGAIFGHHAGASVLRAGYSIASVREGFSVFSSVLGANQGVTVDASVDPVNFPAQFGAPGSVLFRDPSFPTRPVVSAPQYPITPAFSNSVNDFDPNLKLGYVQSWNIGWQRELSRNSVMEVRYTGNHGTDLWRQLGLNEVNIFENGFLNEFNIAANNLSIARQTNSTSNNFGNQGLPGQQNLTILPIALGTTTDVTTANQLTLGQAGAAANAIATNAGRMANLTKNGFPANLFVVNPTVAGGGAYLVANLGSSFYDALQLEFRRRLSTGLQVQASYVFSKALGTGATASSSDFSTPITLRNLGLDKSPEGFDIRNAIKMDFLYELPFGPGRHFVGTGHNGMVRKALEGWQLSGTMRLQSGTPSFFGCNGFDTFNQSCGGVVLHNMTASQLQSMVGIYKTSGFNPDNTVNGQVWFLPQSLIHNTQAAFNTGNLKPANVDPSAPYIGPPAAGQLGWNGYIYLPWQRHFDLALGKRTKITERVNLELRAQALDLFNLTNFLPSVGSINSSFGQITSAYRDISGTVDPGSRIVEFLLRVNF